MDLMFKTTCATYDRQVFPILHSAGYTDVDRVNGHWLRFGHQLYSFDLENGIVPLNLFKHLVFKYGDEKTPLASIEVEKEGDAAQSKWKITALRDGRNKENLFFKRITEILNYKMEGDTNRWIANIVLLSDCSNDPYIMVFRSYQPKLHPKYFFPLKGEFKVLSAMDLHDIVRNELKNRETLEKTNRKIASSLPPSRLVPACCQPPCLSSKILPTMTSMHDGKFMSHKDANRSRIRIGSALLDFLPEQIP